MSDEQKGSWAKFLEVYQNGGTIVAAPDVYNAIVAIAERENIHINDVRVKFSRALERGTMVAIRLEPHLPILNYRWYEVEESWRTEAHSLRALYSGQVSERRQTLFDMW